MENACKECSSCGNECETLICSFCNNKYKKIINLVKKIPKEVYLRKDIGEILLYYIKQFHNKKNRITNAVITSYLKKIEDEIKKTLENKKFKKGPGKMNEITCFDCRGPIYNPKQVDALYFETPIDVIDIVNYFEELLNLKIVHYNFGSILNFFIRFFNIITNPIACEYDGQLKSCIRF